ncbi:unnamed protein product [Ilex paraguariensis]|uniref:Uncharacterized protein n=1 Tax=Ilex paraguariensis TaxID=185542 RepID=A0ABC8R9T4_9AQUA
MLHLSMGSNHTFQVWVVCNLVLLYCCLLSLLVPLFYFSLLSISKIICSLNCLLIFYLSFCVFHDLKMKRKIGTVNLVVSITLTLSPSQSLTNLFISFAVALSSLTSIPFSFEVSSF